MIKSVITINRKKYATGLFWQPVEVGANTYLYARQLITSTQKKYTLFTEYKNMIGLSDGRGGIRAGMSAAAAEVAAALSSLVSFLAVFQVENNYYLVAVRNGVIIRDVLIETEHDARKLYVELSAMPDWTALFSPAAWGMPRSQEKFLSELIRNGSVAKLRQISIVKSVTPLVFLVCALSILGLLLVYSPLFRAPKVKAVKIDQKVVEEFQRQIQEKNEEADKKIEVQKKEIKYPYNTLPDVMERARLCYKAIGFVMQPVAGWEQRDPRCEQQNVTVVFSRTFGSLNGFYEIGSDLMPGGVVTQNSDRQVSVSMKLPELQVGKSIDERDQETVLRDLVSIFQQANINADIRVVNDTVKTILNKVETVNVIKVTAHSKLVPMEFMQAFKDYDGVYMDSVGWNVNGKIWDYSVLVYTK